jgi:hypothetical protein
MPGPEPVATSAWTLVQTRTSSLGRKAGPVALTDHADVRGWRLHPSEPVAHATGHRPSTSSHGETRENSRTESLVCTEAFQGQFEPCNPFIERCLAFMTRSPGREPPAIRTARSRDLKQSVQRKRKAAGGTRQLGRSTRGGGAWGALASNWQGSIADPSRNRTRSADLAHSCAGGVSPLAL